MFYAHRLYGTHNVSFFPFISFSFTKTAGSDRAASWKTLLGVLNFTTSFKYVHEQTGGTTFEHGM